MIVLFQWVSDGSPSHNNAIKIEKPNQFVPLNTNPREFKKVQKMVSCWEYVESGTDIVRNTLSQEQILLGIR